MRDLMRQRGGVALGIAESYFMPCGSRSSASMAHSECFPEHGSHRCSLLQNAGNYSNSDIAMPATSCLPQFGCASAAHDWYIFPPSIMKSWPLAVTPAHREGKLSALMAGGAASSSWFTFSRSDLIFRVSYGKRQRPA